MVIRKIEEVYRRLLALEEKHQGGVTANELSQMMNTDRSNISRYLNELCREKRVKKISGRPVVYHSVRSGEGGLNPAAAGSLEELVGLEKSLRLPIKQAKAAILYPPRGLHTLILGETGVGKSLFAELMHRFAVESKTIRPTAPFIQFNCADYADNPQLLISQIFGVKKGAYTGASRDREGLLQKADGGILFLDEVHRLPPQGQEMLFAFIDKGYFRPLGETEKEATADVQIIAATTEEPRSYLLNTFIRRIPMTITLPSLRERGLKERFSLLNTFLLEESKRVGGGIYLTRNSLISFLLYDCPNNIGQLKSDLQLACARAFLGYKTGDQDYLIISQAELPAHVKKGLLKLHDKRAEVDSILKEKGEILCFSSKEEDKLPEDQRENRYFYDLIEEKLNSLRRVDMDEEQIYQLINIDIESHFQQHLSQLTGMMQEEELREIVSDRVAGTVEEILQLASAKLNRDFDEKIYYGLALHLEKSIERISRGERIYHPELNNIRVNYPEEFMTAMEAAGIIDRRFGIATPLDEIGYLSMFLCKNPFKQRSKRQNNAAVLVLMHGVSTASSMAGVANQLVGVDYALGLDMPLNMDPGKMLDRALQEVNQLDNDREVLLLVDMGSLSGFGELIAEETGRKVRTIERVSTPVVIDACRKAVLGHSLEEIYRACAGTGSRGGAVPAPEANRPALKPEKKAVITSCLTGEGASEKLREVIESRLPLDNLELLTLNIPSRDHFISALEKYQQSYQIVAVVGTVEVDTGEIPFIPAVDILSGRGLQPLQKLITEADIYQRIKDSLEEHLPEFSIGELVEEVREVSARIEESLEVEVPAEVKIGILLHLCFLIQKLRRGDEGAEFQDLLSYQKSYFQEMQAVKTALTALEKKYQLLVGENELAYISNMFLKNNCRQGEKQ